MVSCRGSPVGACKREVAVHSKLKSPMSNTTVVKKGFFFWLTSRKLRSAFLIPTNL